MTSPEENKSERVNITAEEILGRKFGDVFGEGGENLKSIVVEMNNGERMTFTNMQEIKDWRDSEKER